MTESEKSAAAAERADYAAALEQELRAAEINDPKRVPIIKAEIKRTAEPIGRSEKQTQTTAEKKAANEATAQKRAAAAAAKKAATETPSAIPEAPAPAVAKE